MSALLSGDWERYKTAVEDDAEVIVVEVSVLVVGILPFFNEILPPEPLLIGEISRSRKFEDRSRS